MNNINKPIIHKTICYLYRPVGTGEIEILLGMHHKQKKWNGFGGKVADKEEFKGESILEAVVREGWEELSIITKALKERAVITFEFVDHEQQIDRSICHIFFSNSWGGEIKESQELLTPTWFRTTEMPWEDMWQNDRSWLEKILQTDQFLTAHYKFLDPSSETPTFSSESWKSLG